MRLDHLLSREYKEAGGADHGADRVGRGSARGEGLYCIVLSVLKEAVQGQGGRRPGHRGGVAQLGEHLLCKQGVIGSNPFISTNATREGSDEPAGAGEEAGGRGKGRGLIAQQVRAHA